MRIQAGALPGLLAALLIGAASSAWAAADLRLVDAVQKQNKQAVPSLLMQGLDRRATQADGTTALHWAVHWDDLETADLLLRSGAGPNAKNDYDATPLSLACTNGNAAIVERLVSKGGDPNLASARGETPLMLCARTGNTDAVKVLIAHNSDVNAKDNEQNQTALMWAVSQKHPAAVQALIGAQAISIHARRADLRLCSLRHASATRTPLPCCWRRAPMRMKPPPTA